MKMLYKLQVVENHRYAELSIRLKGGGKKWVSKDEASIIGSDDLAPGEEFTILRYQEEGRMLVETVDDDEEPVADEELVTDEELTDTTVDITE